MSPFIDYLLVALAAADPGPASSSPACIVSSSFKQAVVSLLCAAQIPAEMQNRIVRQIVGNFVIIISE